VEAGRWLLLMRLGLGVSLTSTLPFIGFPVGAQQPPPATSREAPAVAAITAVQLQPTAAGLEIVLETPGAAATLVQSSVQDRQWIGEISNAQLALPEGNTFRQDNPAPGIASVIVIPQPENRVQVIVTGEEAAPRGQVFLRQGQGLVVQVTAPTRAGTEPAPIPPAEAELEPIELVVTAERQEDEGYNPSSATTATRTDTPLRDIPQSIQVVPRQVLEERNVRTVTEAVETVSGIVDGADYFGAPTGARIIRGFSQGTGGGNFRNGYRDVDFYGLTGTKTIERVEVLKGPASVLFGAVEPGGIINVITRQPLSEPYYKLAFEAGNYGFFEPSIDLSGPLTADDTVLYRFIANYQDAGSFQEFVNTDLLTIAPSITLNLGDKTALNLYYEYLEFNGIPAESYTGIFSNGKFFPRDFYAGYPDFSANNNTTQRVGYTLNHEFNDNWQIRNNISVVAYKAYEKYSIGLDLLDDQFLEIRANDREYATDNYFGQIDLLGKFNTGPIPHQLLIGFDFNRNVSIFNPDAASAPNLDIFDPDYDVAEPDYAPRFSSRDFTQSYGVYLQDQVSLLENLKLLIGGRLDWISRNATTDGIDDPEQNNSAFSPRIGLVYQPSNTVSLYASYGQSLNPAFGFNPNGEAFEPTRGTQYEFGVRTNFLDGRISANLAAYHLTKSNITTSDPDDPDFSIQVGKQRSQGIELDVIGEILPGWNIVASYAYTDAAITEDNTYEVGNRLVGVPENQVSLWTTYQIQAGDLRGLGFGLGLFYVGERAGDLENSFELPNYVRTDAAIYYRRDQFSAAINIRNLLDTDYIRASDGGSLFLQRGAPFTIIGSVGWEF
jgi:iron complex outermembrane recepter protein